MDLVSNLLLGFENALSLTNLIYCFIGVTVGTLIGVLPGIGPVATIAMLLPITYTLDPSAALIMLAGIYYGAQYGGSTTAILVNLPGGASAVITCLDGHKMATKGRAGAALGIAALGSFFAGCVATLVIAAFAPPLIQVAFKFQPAEYFSLMVLGLVGAIVLANGSLIKAFCMTLLGLLVGPHDGKRRHLFYGLYSKRIPFPHALRPDRPRNGGGTHHPHYLDDPDRVAGKLCRFFGHGRLLESG